MAQHPLEPLSADEFRQTATILRREQHMGDSFRFASIELKEPPKEAVKAWRPGDAGSPDVVRRRARTVPRTRPTKPPST